MIEISEEGFDIKVKCLKCGKEGNLDDFNPYIGSYSHGRFQAWTTYTCSISCECGNEDDVTDYTD